MQCCYLNDIGKSSRLLPYARTTEETELFMSVKMGGNLIEVRSLDLNRPFRDMSATLDSLAVSYWESFTKKA